MKGMTSPFCRAFRSSWLKTLIDWPRVSRKDIGTPGVEEYWRCTML